MIYKMFACASAREEEWYNFNYFLHVRGLLMATSAQLGLYFFLVWLGLSLTSRFLMEVNFSWTKKTCIKIYCIWQVFVNDYGTCYGSRFCQGLATAFSTLIYNPLGGKQ